MENEADAARPVRMVTLASASAAATQDPFERGPAARDHHQIVVAGFRHEFHLVGDAVTEPHLGGAFGEQRFEDVGLMVAAAGCASGRGTLWLWRTCGAPRRFQSNASSAVSGIGVSSRSITVTT